MLGDSRTRNRYNRGIRWHKPLACDCMMFTSQRLMPPDTTVVTIAPFRESSNIEGLRYGDFLAATNMEIEFEILRV